MKARSTLRTLVSGFAASTVIGAGALFALSGGELFAADPVVTMYKDPNCGCCSKWTEHMRANGFTVKEINSSDMATIKRQAGVPNSIGSCHTAKVGGYVIEGHVPAADVKRLLAEKPKVVGISAPGMPMGSPGMEGPYPADRYNVVTFDEKGQTKVFASH